jgi:hypothetical protein
MAWLCPNCGRSFKNPKQQHSCVKINIDDLFVNKSPVVYSIYEKLKKEIKKFGNVKVHASKSAINFSVENTFCVAKPKREWLDVEFLLNEEIIEPPVYKSFKLSKTRYALFSRLESDGDISKNLLKLLKKSYKLSV